MGGEGQCLCAPCCVQTVWGAVSVVHVGVACLGVGWCVVGESCACPAGMRAGVIGDCLGVRSVSGGCRGCV